MAKQLELRFLASDGTTKTITINNPKENLSAGEIQQEMNDIIQTNVFNVDGVNPYQAIKSARYVTRTVEDIFSL